MSLSNRDLGAALWLLGAFSAACAGSNHASRNIDPETVEVSKAEPAEHCTLVGTVEAPMNEDYSRLRMRAAYKDANYVVLDAGDEPFRIAHEADWACILLSAGRREFAGNATATHPRE